MNYYIQDICCFCLNISNDKCTEDSSRYPDNLTPFDKIKTVLLELSAVMDSDSRICKKCSETVDLIYEFNKTSLRNVKILNSYKKTLQENQSKKEFDLFVNLDELKRFKDMLVSEEVGNRSLVSPLTNNKNDKLGDTVVVSESQSSNFAEVKEEIQVNCEEESERPWLNSKIKIEPEETNLKQEWTSETSKPLMDEFLKPTFKDFGDFPVQSTEEVFVKEENLELVENPLEVAEEISGESLDHFQSQVEKQSESFQETPLQAFECAECGKTLSDKFNLDKHMLTHSETKNHTGKKTHKCDTCGTLFVRKDHLKAHMLIHTGESPHKCNTCGKLFSQKGHLNSHMLIHTGEKPHKCNICGKLFSQKGHFNLHVLIHTDGKPHKCHICESSFRRKDHLESHILIHTGENLYKCDTCEKLFRDKSNLKKHMIIHTGESSHKCDICGKVCSQKSHLESHMLKHTGEKPHKCHICEKLFTVKKNLTRHMLIHTGEKPYKCDVCGKLFLKKNTLETHMLIHTGEKPHNCDICGKFFTQKTNLNRHMLTHTGEKPHKCDICGKVFIQNSNLKKHMLTHAGESQTINDTV